MSRALEATVAVAAAALAALVVAAALPRPEAATSPAAAAETLRRDPLNLTALRVEALAAAEAGEPRRATRTLEFVAARTWRDGPTDAWLMRDRLQRGDLAGGLASADALLRLDPHAETRPVLFPLLTTAANFVEARPILAERLSADPWWRQDFLQYLALHGDPSGAAELFADLATGPRPGRGVEYAPLIDRLVAARDYDGAIAAWRRIAPPVFGPAAALRDGDFALTWDHTPFTWRPADGVGVTSETRDQVDGPAKRALRIDYDAFGAPTLPGQLLILPAGRWRLSWRVRADAQADRRLYWRVRCADSGEILAGAPADADASPAPGWRVASLIFETPPADCHGQWLELIPVPGERRTQITASYAGFRLQPES